MRESDIKVLLINRLRAEGTLSKSVIVANEYPLGRTSVRADLALLGRDFVGVEIKSERDTLRRLSHQLSVYRQFFDRTVLVVAERHLSAAQVLNLEGVDLWRLKNGKVDLLAAHPKVGDQRPLAELLTAAQRQKWVERLELDQGRDAFAAAFRSRFGPTSRQFWEAVGRRKVRTDDLVHLSRFQRIRSDQARIRTERALSWNQWSEKVEAIA